jgi:hypothetical protein
MRSNAGRFLSFMLALAAVAFGAHAARADQQQEAPPPAAASTSAPTDVNIHFKNGTTYSGNATVAYPKTGRVNPGNAASTVQFVNGKPPKKTYSLILNGPGKITFSDGSTLSGDFVNGVVEGQGEFVKPGSFEFKGDFSDGQPTSGTVTFVNGPTYEGSFADGLPSGAGTLTASGPVTEATGQWSKGLLVSGYEVFADGARFDGTFGSDGKPEGSGTYRYADGTTLSGTWQDGLFAGPVVERYRNGTVLTVNVSPPDSSLHGAALVAFRDGDRASGRLTQSGELDGPGSYSFLQGPRILGTFNTGNLRGPATLITPSGRQYRGRIEQGVFISPHYKQYFGDGRTYQGPVDAQGRANGRGVYRFIDGETLSGTWVHGRMSGEVVDHFPGGTTYRVHVNPPAEVLHGPATITFPNGDQASALLSDGTLNGSGKYLYAATGNRIDGTFDHGRLQGPATLTTPDGDRYEGKMVDGTVQ